jgi:hypothetical protein
MMIGRFFLSIHPAKGDDGWVVHHGFCQRFTMGTVVGSTASTGIVNRDE